MNFQRNTQQKWYIRDRHDLLTNFPSDRFSIGPLQGLQNMRRAKSLGGRRIGRGVKKLKRGSREGSAEGHLSLKMLTSKMSPSREISVFVSAEGRFFKS